MWDPYKKGFKAFLQLERSLSDNSVEAYLRDIEKLTQFLQEKNNVQSVANVTLADLYRPSTAATTNIPVEVVSESLADQSYRYSDRFIESGSYLRLDNFTLGYKILKNTKAVKSVRLYISGTNIFTVTGYKGIDPEVNMGGIAPGVDTNNFYPKTRTFLFGVNVSL